VLKIDICLLALAAVAAAPGGAQTNPMTANRINQPGRGDPIAREVRHELVMLPYYGVFDDLGFKVNGSAVTLLGRVTRPALKTDAENAVKRIEGVEKVENRIEVLPLSAMDDTTRIAEYRAIYGDPVLNRYALQAVPPIHIIVADGRVSLVGVVASQSDKDLAGIRANGVTGVFSVENNLTVERQ
jgi:hyperosmotically inducible protein